MSNDEKLELITSLLPKGWNVETTEEGAVIENKKGVKKNLLIDDSFISIDGKTFSFKKFESALSLIVSFILQCFDGKIRM